MLQSLTLKTGILVFVCLCKFATAQQVVYVSGDDNGQGILRLSQDNCYLIAPKHVIGFASEISLINSYRQKVNAIAESEYPPDISVSKLTDKASCSKQWPSSRWINNAIANIENAALISRQADGSLKRRFVLISEFDDMWLKVRTKYTDETLFQGLSGSALSTDGKLLGQLISIDTNTSIGMVLRQDFIDSVLKNRFGEGFADHNGLALDENLLSDQWLVYGDDQKKGSIVTEKDKVVITYSGAGKDRINIGLKQLIPVSSLSGLQLSFKAQSSTTFDEVNFAVVAVTALDNSDKRLSTIYTSPDKYMVLKKPSSSQKWSEGEVVWDLGKLFNNLSANLSKIEVSIFIYTPKSLRCTGCKIELNNIKMNYKN